MESEFGWCAKCAGQWKIIRRILEPNSPCCVCWNCGVESKYRTMEKPKFEFIPIKVQNGRSDYSTSNLPRPSEIRHAMGRWP